MSGVTLHSWDCDAATDPAAACTCIPFNGHRGWDAALDAVERAIRSAVPEGDPLDSDESEV